MIPAYNAARHLARCLESIQAQTFTDFEVMVVDDGSTDETLEIARAHAADDERIQVLSQQNSYAGVARNAGMEHARGEYFAFLDADDFFEPRMFESMLERALEADADVVICESNFFDDLTHEVRPIDFALQLINPGYVYAGRELQDEMFRFCVGWPWDKLYKADFIRRHQLKFQDLRTTNDAYFVFMALMLAERIAFVPEAFVMHRTNNSDSLERTRGKSWQNAMAAALAIEQRLREENLYDHFERSFVNWLLNFSLWNFETLDGEAQEGLLICMEQQVAPRLPLDAKPDYYFTETDARAAALLGADRRSLLKRGLMLEIDVVRERQAVAWHRERSDCKDGEIKRRDEEIEQLQREKETLLASTTYEVGKKVMAVPCAIKDLLGKKR